MGRMLACFSFLVLLLLAACGGGSGSGSPASVVTNTSANRLDIFTLSEDALVLQVSVTVGLEPVAVAVRNSNEVWVVTICPIR